MIYNVMTRVLASVTIHENNGWQFPFMLESIDLRKIPILCIFLANPEIVHIEDISK